MTDTGSRALIAAATAIVTAGTIGVALVAFDGGRFSFWEFAGLALVIGVPIAGLHALFVGLPLYVFATKRWTLRWWSAAFGGFLTGLLPASVFVFFHVMSRISSGDGLVAFSGISDLLMFGVPGAIGGLVFRAIRGERPPRPA